MMTIFMTWQWFEDECYKDGDHYNDDSNDVMLITAKILNP